MQVVLERFFIAAFVSRPCLLCPVQALGYETSSNSNAHTARLAIAEQQVDQVHRSIDASSGKAPMHFATRFVQSCTSSRTGDDEFYLSRFKVPLK